MKDDRITIRLNPQERAELESFKRSFNLDKDSEALKLSLNWVNHYIKNVTSTFFPSNYNLVLVRKLKTQSLNRKVYD